jgi:N-acetyl-gamma-glutamyl-phosphate reductase/acetylglutamate kinase
MPLSERLTAKDVKALYEDKYAGEKLITIKREVPSLQDVENKHGWTVGGFQVHSDGDRAVVVVRCSCRSSGRSACS